MRLERDKPGKTNRSLAAKLFMFALGSFGFGFALVPLYDVLCAVTGQGDQSALARAAVGRRTSGSERAWSPWTS